MNAGPEPKRKVFDIRLNAQDEEMKKQWALILLTGILFSIKEDITNAAGKRWRSTSAVRVARAPQLGSVEQFKEAFEQDVGSVRLVALISPT